MFDTYTCSSCEQEFLKADCSAQKFANHRKNCPGPSVDDQDSLRFTEQNKMKDEAVEHESSSSGLLAMLDSAREVRTAVASSEPLRNPSVCPCTHASEHTTGGCSWAGRPPGAGTRNPRLRNRRPRDPRKHPSSRPASPTAHRCTHAQHANRHDAPSAFVGLIATCGLARVRFSRRPSVPRRSSPTIARTASGNSRVSRLNQMC